MPLGGNLFDDSVFGVDGFCCGEQELLVQHLAMLLDWKDIDLGMQMVHSSHFQTSRQRSACTGPHSRMQTG